MANTELEEKINKIRLQNEKIRQRHEEVEADKKNAAKLNALVKLVPSDDWPQRKEPPEFSAPPKAIQKQKILNKDHIERPIHYTGVQERLSKKDHKFAQGDGPPPDPKYNFLADSERETYLTEDDKIDDDKNKSRNKSSRHPPRKRTGTAGAGGNGAGGPKEAFFKDNRGPHAFHSKGESLPEYKAWRAERDRIDEARINRQKTAEGNWRREWDVNKTSVERESEHLRKGDINRKDYDRRSHHDDDFSNRSHGSRTYHGSQKNHGNQDYRRSYHEQTHDYKRQIDNKQPLSSYLDDRTLSAIDQNMKVTLNHSNQAKGQVMSVKVSSPSIAGTGRVGPRQKSRVTYSSQSDTEGNMRDINISPRQKSFDEKSGINYNSNQKATSKSPYTQRKEGNLKSPYSQRKDFRYDESSTRPKNSTKGSNPGRTDTKDQRHSNSASKLQRPPKQAQKLGAEMLRDVPIDDAIPSEYNPNKLHNKDIIAQTVYDNNENVEASDNLIEVNTSLTDLSNNLDISTNIEPIQNTNAENFNHSIEYNESINIVKINEEIKINEDVANIKIAQVDEKTINEEIDTLSTYENIEIDNHAIGQSIDKNESEINRTNIEENETVENTSNVNIDETKKDEQLVLRNELVSLEKKNSIVQEPVDDLINTELKNDEMCNANEEKSEKIEEKVENLNSDKVETDVIVEEQNSNICKETNNKVQEVKEDSISTSKTDELQNTIENILIELKDEEATILKIPQNSSLDDSGIGNSSSELNDTKTSELNMSLDSSFNDSGFKSNVLITEPNSKNEIQKNSQELVESDSVDITKENCEKLVEICDNHSTREILQVNDDRVEKIDDHNEVKTSFENSTKDSDVNIVKDEEKSSEFTVQKVIKDESSEENFVKEESVSAMVEESNLN